MRDRDDELLFWGRNWYTQTEAQKAGVIKKANSYFRGMFDKASLDQLADALVEEFNLVPPTVYVDRLDVSQREVELDVSRRGGYDYGFMHESRYVKGTAISVRIPFEGDAGMFQVRPTSMTLNPPRGRVEGGYVTFEISGVNLSRETVKAEIDQRVKSTVDYVDFQRKSIGNFPAELRRCAYEALQQRLDKLTADQDLVSGLGYAIRR
ncbi:MAG: hypothetical protein JO208_01490 [Alphaproteobacteria bacterium]|nr:hypothetical protein [Alphaproteobacteria bacterium]